VQAAVATEDVRYYSHSGIDFQSLGRVIFKTLLGGDSSQGGGSTITQQLAKTLYPRADVSSRIPGMSKVKMVWIKLKEWVTAVKLERSYTKDEIMTMYMNQVFFGSNAYGIKAAAQTFRPNPAFSTEREILELGTGEALVSFLDEKGAPSIVQRAKILFPLSQIGAITDEQRAELIASSRIAGKYDEAVDRESAFEKILKQREKAAAEAAEAEAQEQAERERELKEKEQAKSAKRSSGMKKSIIGSIIGTAATYFAKTLAQQMARKITGGTVRTTTTKKKKTTTKKKR
jgi:membrane peptidoglycan carboxypeptidase